MFRPRKDEDTLANVDPKAAKAGRLSPVKRRSGSPVEGEVRQGDFTMGVPEKSPPPQLRPLASVRNVVEFAVCLAIAVTSVRAFFGQGYMIETGSMGPALRGYHRAVKCPSCGFETCVGESHALERLTCPNCDLESIDLAHTLRNDGDQLLVARAAFEWQQPRRWGVMVFRNPGRPEQAFVKRIAGLPGETLRIVRGDVFINGRIQPKPLGVRRSQQVLVHDFDFQPQEPDPDWRPRWYPENEGQGWQQHGSRFGFNDLDPPPREKQGAAAAGPAAALTSASKTPADDLAEADCQLVRYRHWIRAGGRHKTWTPLSAWPAGVPLPGSIGSLRYEPAAQRLVCEGALPAARARLLLGDRPHSEFVTAVERLFAASHIAPVLDIYGYNGGGSGPESREVRDLCVRLKLDVHTGSGKFVLGITDGTESFELRLLFSQNMAQLVRLNDSQVVRHAPLPTGSAAAEWELSLMDRRASATLNGSELFPPFDCPSPARLGGTPWKPVWFGAKRLSATVSRIRLYRDVHYTPAGERGVTAPVTLGPDEFFMLGDNSPLSNDSRTWEPGQTVTRNLILGKPIIVHLPSVRKRLQLGSWSTQVRIPEFSRIRYIR